MRRVNEANCGTNDDTDYGSFNYFLSKEKIVEEVIDRVANTSTRPEFVI